MKRTICLALVCILICTVSVGCRGKRNPDGLSDSEAYDLVKEKLTDELKAEFVDMFEFIVSTYPGYRYYKYYPEDDRQLEDSGTLYINKNSFDEEELAYIVGVVDKLGASYLGIDQNPTHGMYAYFHIAPGEFGNGMVELDYYANGQREDRGAWDLGDGWGYSYPTH